MSKSFALGAVSVGTLRPVDLIDAFAYELRAVAPGTCKELLAASDAWLEADTDESAPVQDVHEETGSELVNDLQDALNECAPPYVSFGTTEGDGACFGWYPCIDSLDEACASGECLKVNDLADIPRAYVGDVMLVNDHGNVTYGSFAREKFNEAWSCV